jgi:hypothetical protein
MANCPFDTEVWASLSVLGHKEYEDKPYSKLFCFDYPGRKLDEQAGLEIAQARGLPVISRMNSPFVTELIPLRKMSERFNSCFWLNDMSYMIAYALYLGYKSLLLWGVDQGPEPMYRETRKYVTYWLGVATGMGVQWELAPNSILWIKDD